MEYAVGENVVHPAHGAGTIVDIQEHEIIEGLTRYYVIEFDVNNLTVSVPVRRTKQIGLRAVMTEEKFTQVINTLSKRPKQLPKDYKERRALLAGLIQSGPQLGHGQLVVAAYVHTPQQRDPRGQAVATTRPCTPPNPLGSSSASGSS